MTFSMRRFSAIFRKEVQDFKTNSQTLIMMAMPIFFAILFSRSDNFREVGASMLITMTLVFVGGFIQAMLIAEEKERSTLRVLMLSPASSIEVLIGKSSLTGMITIAICFINLLILGKLEGNIALLLLIFVLGMLLFNLIGTCIGLLAQNVPQTSTIGLPILMVFLLGDFIGMYVKNEVVTKTVEYLPTRHIGIAVSSVIKGEGFSAITSNLLNITIWLVVVLAITLFVYRKKQID
ncbi:ABC transporter permease [Bacillus pseudomycoides]|uniref:ABC transporter permease n=1 Tax=Bacillus pseudomycoides TaxID=64104 RepID=A0AA91ZUE4_9BACI|nr:MULTISPECIES: ABC transporter permease [Bacillus]PEB50437.1 ABC transporter permease [Bacillus sp. AFS098217]PED83574.1 ABC transporter permease [Bacillus pseudomycoides]PEU09209.1 ABC transporter permease [Bacillus sp. AFS014408]PEU10380.1 ABC transporter permease [Bacillus sp. AFS019443]PFW64067.1 ABC transporter permease [Bacillus sp. AFS075034]